ncbi:DUF5329 family protein [Variovorax sp. JS1663]|uniref:DUF5329 family protein n=1 Tax=Variovorax sp. JS1663 TaxID=1851577 RepID=UPI000B344132|nr:DUF5329 family protein [Variovorax sp. JS1663]OUL99868.1 hypothetical protein A8M77_24375 [Variovorax sp. JS1663]
MRRRHCLRLAALALGPALLSTARATPSEEEHRLITALIQRVRGMRTMKFMRNDEAHDADEAAKHLEAKYKHFRKQIVTAEDFIERCATRSEVTGKAYIVQLGDGKPREARAFMLQELRAMRQPQPPKHKG